MNGYTYCKACGENTISPLCAYCEEGARAMNCDPGDWEDYSENSLAEWAYMGAVLNGADPQDAMG